MTGQRGSLASSVDHERFADLELVIERGLGTFVDVGRALFEIQERRLYRTAGHRTFADYVAKRWDLSKTHAYRQIEASKIVDILSPIGDIPLPTNEAQARELAPLMDDPDAIRAVWTEAIESSSGHATARSIRERVAARRPRPRAGTSGTRQSHAAGRDKSTCPACGHQWSE
jgi:hypothetical protein